MYKYSYNHKTPVEAKIMLLFGICGGDPSDIELTTDEFDGSSVRMLSYKNERINKDVLDYVRTILLWEDKKLVEFIEISKVSFQSSKYRYRILEKDTYINKE
tara:strand:+ start:1436 stop:1741 length:306 start_codon:yes stop_codon:yes gene_type:complete